MRQKPKPKTQRRATPKRKSEALKKSLKTSGKKSYLDLRKHKTMKEAVPKKKRRFLRLAEKIKIVNFLKKHKQLIEKDQLTQQQVANWASKELGFQIPVTSLALCSKQIVKVKWTRVRRESSRLKASDFYTKAEGMYLEASLSDVVGALLEHDEMSLRATEKLKEIQRELDRSVIEYSKTMPVDDD